MIKHKDSKYADFANRMVTRLEFEEAKRWTSSDLKQHFNLETYLFVHGRDFNTYIEDYNIKFVSVDTQKVVSNIEATPALDKIYNNGRAIVYTTKK